MKLAILSMLFIISCSRTQKTSPLPSNVAYDEMAAGNIKASATRTISKQDVCFDITLIMKNVSENEAFASNWTVAWIDTNSRYHLLNNTLRDPASTPAGSYERWTNHFRICAPRDHKNEIKSLILTPKELSYKETEGMELQWP